MTTDEFKALCVGIGAAVMATLLFIKGFIQVSKEVMDKIPSWVSTVRKLFKWFNRGCRDEETSNNDDNTAL